MARSRVSGGDVAIYQQRGGQVRLAVRLEGETLWLSLAQMAELFGRDKSVIGKHLRNVFRSGELRRPAVAAKNAATAADGKSYLVEYFNLDAILSVGYRVNSKRGTQFRIWATHTLRDHLLRGYTLNERRLREKGLGEMIDEYKSLVHPRIAGHGPTLLPARALTQGSPIAPPNASGPRPRPLISVRT